MIIDTSQGNIEVVGDVKEFKTSIDPKNLEFITTLLSSNLYSDPEQSFIREIVSNAWDSHVEAGNTDIPVIVRFGKDNNNNHQITIRDYGVGLSPERFQEVYCNIGSSTKRDSNEFIGGFGIGKYSSLACSNTVYITSYYAGTAYYYVMVKSGNSITTNLLMEKPTAEKNGVEVTIKNITDIAPYKVALSCIIFFPNIYIDGISCSDSINKVKLKRFTNFAACSKEVSSRLLLGNVLYPCNTALLPIEARLFLNRIVCSGIVVKFDVGEINITPNRENIIYNPETIKKITDRIAAAETELNSLVCAKLEKDYDDIVEYSDTLSRVRYYDPVSDEIVLSHCGYKVEPMNISSTKITYKGSDLKDDVNTVDYILRVTLPNYRGVVFDDRIYVKNVPYVLSSNSTLRSKEVLILNSKARLTEYAKLYLKRNYNRYGIMTDITYKEFEDWLEENAKALLPEGPNKDIILKGIYDSLYKRAKRLDLDTDAGFLKFKKELSSNRSTIPVKNAILYVYNRKGWREKLHFSKFSNAVDYIKKLKKGVVLCGMTDATFTLQAVAELKGYVLIHARKDIIEDLKKLNLSCVVDTNWLLHKDPLLSSVKTVLVNFPDKIDPYVVKEICDNIPKEEAKEVDRILKLRNVTSDDWYYTNTANHPDVKYDPYIEYLCIKLKNYITKHIEAKEIVISSSGIRSATLTTAVVMKTKAYRISGEAYQKVKNNKLLRVLCKK